MMLRTALLVSAAAMLAAGAAQATSWNVAFTGTGGANRDTAAFRLLTSNTQNGAGGYNIRGATGQIDGFAITGLIAPGTAGTYFVSTDGRWNLDNTLFGSAPFMSNNGWGFTLANGSEVNVWAASPNSHAVANGSPSAGNLIQFADSAGYGRISRVRVSVSPVPEPATWGLMLVGFGAIGYAMRRQRKVAISFG